MNATMKQKTTNNHGYSYSAALAASQKVNWRIEDVIGGDKQLDFSKPFLPESFAHVKSFDFLSSDEKRTLNQIRSNAYLCIFGLVEEFILPFVIDHTRLQLHGDDYRVRALLQFAGEEAKHIQLFKRFREEFEKGFGASCTVIGPPEAIAQAVLAHDPLAVAITILHLEWMTQRHYTDSVQDNQALDPQFKSLLKHHWMEEAQHARLDTLVVSALGEGRTPQQIEAAVAEYLEIGALLDGGLKQQVEFDLEAFQRVTGRELTLPERDRFTSAQTQANRWTYLGSGMTHPIFLTTLGDLKPEARTQIEQIAPAFC